MTPEYILNNWTEELLELMIEKLVERKEQENKVVSFGSKSSQTVPDNVLFSRAKNLIKVVKK